MADGVLQVHMPSYNSDRPVNTRRKPTLVQCWSSVVITSSSNKQQPKASICKKADTAFRLSRAHLPLGHVFNQYLTETGILVP